MFLAAGATVASVESSPTAGALPFNPDAVLLALVDQHAATLRAWTRHTADADSRDDDPLWDAYTAILDACHATPATTLAGLVAKARIAKVEMATPADGVSPALADPAEKLAQSIVHDLLRIAATA